MSSEQAASLFHEEQPLRPPWLALAVLPALVTLLAAARLSGAQWAARVPVSAGDLVFFAILLWVVYRWLARVRLVTDVTRDGMAIGLRGLLWRVRVAPSDWRSVSAVTFDAMREFGGFGLRCSGRIRAYVARGNAGVRLDLRDGDVVIVGSDRPEQLRAALTSVRTS